MRDIDRKNEDFTLEDTEVDSLEEEDIVVSEEGVQDRIKSLKSKLKTCEEERRQFHEDLLRARADFLNSKRRLEEDSVRNADRAAEKMLRALLPVIDSFEMAMRENQGSTKGLEAVYTQFQSLLRSYGIEEIQAIRTTFDPAIHEAVSNREAEDTSEIDTVIEVLQKGYRRGDTIIRPARVVVGIAKGN